jgi:hypothetical protein
MLCAVILGLLAQLSNTASVEGIVAKLGTGEPLARAAVTLSNDRYPSQVLRTTTDASGRFSFLNIPPGEYRLQASRQDRTFPQSMASARRLSVDFLFQSSRDRRSPKSGLSLPRPVRFRAAFWIVMANRSEGLKFRHSNRFTATAVKG